ncbi:thiamine-phosphate kinase [Acidisphaera rubrifaciens]|uniref:Thiamine-monophosphate kinase n=1 Tax=Acidisphaera rubrifaciens HS-AP3 TaxID=1231350 RepID=A0A0D6P6X5_9PROT|nr:thiamine-phosphate kinase [Acidisphaera rubrifaciens]GAN77096.1 thiamine monophosphate kinase [Acidisphaera rubrifaciens HS-AP3]
MAAPPATRLPPEFDRIARHFAPLAGPAGLGLTDDAALLEPPAGRALVLTVDAMVAGVHYLPDDPPDLVARKLLRVNLSDLAAKGAVPLGYLLTVSVPVDTPDDWFARFAAGLAADQAAYGLALLGGDTTGTPGAATLTATLIGHVAPGGMVRRGGAVAGDLIVVTGTIGDGALGLAAARGQVPDPDGFLAGRYRLPTPRLGLIAPDVAHAALDVSDGLVQDLGHLCRASGVSAEIDAGAVPASAAAFGVGGQGDRTAWLATRLTGGDDYEIVMAVPPGRLAALRARAGALGIPVTPIGVCRPPGPGEPPGVTVLHDGAALTLGPGGWSHF